MSCGRRGAIDSINATAFFPRTSFDERPAPGHTLEIEACASSEDTDMIALDRVIWRNDAPPRKLHVPQASELAGN